MAKANGYLIDNLFPMVEVMGYLLNDSLPIAEAKGYSIDNLFPLAKALGYLKRIVIIIPEVITTIYSSSLKLSYLLSPPIKKGVFPSVMMILLLGEVANNLNASIDLY